MRRVSRARLPCTGVLLTAWLAAGGVAPALLDEKETVPLPPTVRRFCELPADSPLFRTFFDGRLCPLEKRLFADASDGRLDEHSLLDAALVASGEGRAEALQRYQEQLAAPVDELWRSGELAGPPRRQAQVLFEFMHRRILHAGYRIDSTDLRTAIDQGRFNCVSASVLFNCLAGEFGLAVCGLEIPGHAMSRLMLPDGPLDVETTCPCWFRLMNDPRKQSELVEKTIGRDPSQDRWQAREVSAVELVAMIYYNRGVELLAEKRFDQAAVANAKALRLDPSSTTARGNLLATINNWAVALSSSDRYAEAVGLLRAGLSFDPHYEAFALNYVHVHHQWVERLCGAGRFAEALDVLAKAAADLPDRQYFQRASWDVYRRWAQSAADRGELAAAMRRTDQRGGPRPAAIISLLGVHGLRSAGSAARVEDGGLFRLSHLTTPIP